MKNKKFTSMVMLGCLVTSLISTSFGGAFATSALAAEPGVTSEENNNGIIGGVVALGLIAALSHKGGNSHDASSPSKSTTQPSGQAPSSSVSNPSTTAPTTTTPSTSLSITADEQKAFNLLNADRAAQGLKPLKLNPDLTRLGENYAQDMINRNFFSHTNPEGQSPFDRMKAAGISYTYAGENIAINTNVNTAEVAFMNSPGHRANILSPNYTDVGLGVRYAANGSAYVVQEFISK